MPHQGSRFSRILIRNQTSFNIIRFPINVNLIALADVPVLGGGVGQGINITIIMVNQRRNGHSPPVCLSAVSVFQRGRTDDLFKHLTEMTRVVVTYPF